VFTVENRHKVILDFKYGSVTHVDFVQNDTDSCVLEFVITDGGQIVDVTDQTISIAFLKPDNTIVIQDINNGVSILNNGNVECLLKSNTLAVVGTVQVALTFSQNGVILSTPEFHFMVSRSLENGEGILSTNEIPIIDAEIALMEEARLRAIDALLQAETMIESPVFTGEPRAPTPATTDNSTKIATTAFVQNQNYVFNQMVSSDLWTITHNLGRHPAVTVVDSAGGFVVGDITYTDTNTLQISFSAEFSGKVYLN